MMSKPKTEVQCVGRDRQQLKIVLEDEELKQVDNFVYFGGAVSADQSRDTYYLLSNETTAKWFMRFVVKAIFTRRLHH